MKKSILALCLSLILLLAGCIQPLMMQEDDAIPEVTPPAPTKSPMIVPTNPPKETPFPQDNSPLLDIPGTLNSYVEPLDIALGGEFAAYFDWDRETVHKCWERILPIFGNMTYTPIWGYPSRILCASLRANQTRNILTMFP